MKAILTTGDPKKRTTIESGDIIAYDEIAKSLMIVRNRSVILIDGRDKLYLPLEGAGNLHSIAKVISMITGMGFELITTLGHKNAYKFSFLIRE